jgi:hypothetical protein
MGKLVNAGGWLTKFHAAERERKTIATEIE